MCIDCNNRKKCNEPEREGLEYLTWSASQEPCSCAYTWGGFKDPSRVWQWSDKSRNPRPLDLLCSKTVQCLQRKLGVTLSQEMPGYLVGNQYANPSNYIGMHSDSHELFDAVEHEAVIFSLNLNCDAPFVVHPRYGEVPEECELLRHLGISTTSKTSVLQRICKQNLVHTFLARQNSLLIMALRVECGRMLDVSLTLTHQEVSWYCCWPFFFFLVVACVVPVVVFGMQEVACVSIQILCLFFDSVDVSSTL